MTYAIFDGLHKDSVLDFFYHDDVPVVVRGAGVYPTLADESGTRVNVPMIEIIYLQDPTDLKAFSRATISVNAGLNSRYRSMILTAGQLLFEPSTDRTPHLDDLREMLDEAVTLLREAPRRYEEADNRIAQAKRFDEVLTREAYEQACDTLGVATVPDESPFLGYTYDYPTYTADHILGVHLAIARQRGIQREVEALGLPDEMDRSTYDSHCEAHGIAASSDEELTHTVWAQLPSARAEGLKEALDRARVMGLHREASQSARRSPAKPTGQLWEPCPKCGSEPIYMPLHVCLDCWPKGAAAN